MTIAVVLALGTYAIGSVRLGRVDLTVIRVIGLSRGQLFMSLALERTVVAVLGIAAGDRPGAVARTMGLGDVGHNLPGPLRGPSHDRDGAGLDHSLGVRGPDRSAGAGHHPGGPGSPQAEHPRRAEDGGVGLSPHIPIVPYQEYNRVMAWEVEYTDEFGQWWHDLYDEHLEELRKEGLIE